MGIVEKDLTITDRYGVANSSLRVYFFLKSRKIFVVFGREKEVSIRVEHSNQLCYCYLREK
jgi:hypothetical protein